jgi:hypothetical protein
MWITKLPRTEIARIDWVVRTIEGLKRWVLMRARRARTAVEPRARDAMDVSVM